MASNSTLIITYDMRDGGADEYLALHEAIKGYGTWAHISESTWAIVTVDKPSEVRDHIKSLLTPGSRLFVLRSGTVAAWSNVICSADWLKKYL